MRLSAILAVLVAAAPALGGDDLTVLKPGKDEPSPRKLLYNALLKEAQQHFDARRKTVAALKTPDDVRRRQAELKAKFIEALGGFPEKSPLNAKTVGHLKGDGFRVEKVIYESRPGHHVTANLYLPDGKGPFPGVLVPCGHSANGKAAEPYQRVSILLAKNGMAALCYDPIGQGERSQILDKAGKPRIAGSTSEHTMVGVGALLVGRCTATYRIWDGIRSLDYLASRPEVDAKRLGCTGNSGGGTLTAYLMALDDRIVAAAPSCYITSLEKLFATIGPQDAEQNIPGQVAFGMEHADYITMRAPLPTLVCCGTQDFFDIGGSWASFREASLLYGLMGHGERVALFEYNDKHGFSKPRREAAMRWMRRWLLKIDDAPVEGKFPAFKDADLQCTRSGQVLEDFRGKSVVHFNAERAGELAEARAKAARPPEKLLAEVRRLIGVGKQQDCEASSNRKVRREGYDIKLFVYRVGDDFPLPGLFFAPKDADRKSPLAVYVSGGGMAAAAGEGGPIEKLVKAGKRVLAVDLRGWGETAPAVPKGKPGYFGSDSREAFLAMHLARPLLGRRVADLLGVIRCLKAEAEGGVELIGTDAASPVALHAAALSPDVRSLTLDGSLVSWSNVVATPVSVNQLSNAVPGALAVYDLPELAALIAPRPFTLRGTVDAAGHRVPREELGAVYAPVREAYTRANARDQFTLQTSP